MAMFTKATRKKSKLRLALCGTSGSGKTYSALLVAKGLGGKCAVIDTENGSASLYEGVTDYDVCEIAPPYTVEKYIAAIHEAEKEGYNVLIIDSLSHAWAGQGGLLEEVDKKTAASRSKNSYTAWRDVTPLHNKLVDTILQSPMHIIVTMRTKTAYEINKNDNGKTEITKVGLAPIQRDGLEYEFTVVLDLENSKHMATAGKDRTGIFDGKAFVANEETGQQLLEWLEKGADIPSTQKQRSEIFVKATELNISSDEMKKILKIKYDIESSKELTMSQANDLKNNIEKYHQDVSSCKADDAILDNALDLAMEQK